MTGTVTTILSRQSTCIRYFFCWECKLQFKQQVAITMQPHLLTCPGCEIHGYVTGNVKR